MTPFSALVLAGRRGGRDPFAEAHGAASRGLVPVAGVPMLLRVVRALEGATRVGAIRIAHDDADTLRAHPELDRLLREERVGWHPAGPSPSGTVLSALRERAPGEKLLVTTADHALLSPEVVDAFLAADAGGADVRVGCVAESVLRARHPEGRRTWLRLRDEAYTGANLFAFETDTASRAAQFWQRAESFRKRPWRLVLTLGPATLWLFLWRRLSLPEAMERVSRAIGVRICVVPLPYADAAIDVDSDADLALAERILAERAREEDQSSSSDSARKEPVARS